MKLIEVFDHLAYGELAQYFERDEVSNEIPEAKYRSLVSHINMGLTELHKRFLLKEGRLTITRSSSIFTYVLAEEYAISNTNSTAHIKYINDTAETFQGNIFKIERVYDDQGCEFPLNIENEQDSLFTPSFNLLRVPSDLENKTTSFEVVYRANHHRLVYTPGLDPSTVDIHLPYSHLEALLLYVASRVFNPIGMGASEFHEGNNYASKFEQACATLKDLNLESRSDATVDTFRMKGFV